MQQSWALETQVYSICFFSKLLNWLNSSGFAFTEGYRRHQGDIGMRFYSLGLPSLWGGFGDTLRQGLAERDDNGQLELSRTGPFVPPVIILGYRHTIVLTNSSREKIMSSGLVFPPIREVLLKHVVKFHWEHWDRTADLPIEQFPPMEELEDLIDGQPHSEEVAQQMRPLWEFRVPAQALGKTEIINERGSREYDVRLYANGQTTEYDFFGGSSCDILVTERAKKWLEQEAGEWVMFHDVIVSDTPGA